MDTLAWLHDVWELAKNAGPFGTILMLYIYMSERKERRSAQRESARLAVSYIKATNDLNTSLRELVAAVKRSSKRQ